MPVRVYVHYKYTYKNKWTQILLKSSELLPWVQARWSEKSFSTIAVWLVETNQARKVKIICHVSSQSVSCYTCETGFKTKAKKLIQAEKAAKKVLSHTHISSVQVRRKIAFLDVFYNLSAVVGLIFM